MNRTSCWALVLLFLVGYCHAASFLAAVVQHEPVVTGASPAAIVAANFQRYGEAAKQAANQNASIAVFPEFGLGMDCLACTSPQQQNDFCESADFAAGMWVSINTCEAASDGNYNTNLVFDDQGAFVAKYRKSHPWFVKVKPFAPQLCMRAYSASFCCAVLRKAGRGGSGYCPAAVFAAAWHFHLLRHTFFHSFSRACSRRDSPLPIQFRHSYHWLRGSELLVPAPSFHPNRQQYDFLAASPFCRAF
jgi:hypothetical protein